MKCLKQVQKILMFPILLKNEDAMIHEMRNYEQSWPKVYSDNLQWITRSNKADEQWLKGLSYLPTTEMLKYVLMEDIDGIWLDENGYDVSEFEDIKMTFDEVIGEPVVVSETGKQYYYALENCRKQFMEQQTKQEISELKAQSQKMRNEDGYYIGPSDLLIFGREDNVVNKMMTLHKGDVQYGPYLPLKKGKYQLKIVGENLQNTDFFIHFDLGTQNIDYSIIESENSGQTVNFELSEDLENIEFVLSNNKEQDVILYYYYICELK